MTQSRGVWFRVLLYALGLYICNSWLDLIAAPLFALYTWLLGTGYLLFSAPAWKDPLSFAFCYGFFLGIQGFSKLLAWGYGLARFFTG
jgi:hypothetical protein